ncbi:hypothetical protein DOTSEDRAFT_73768 [Dothistroma septosporum NZE10]|uniref:Uncharacterized protein n=1 Tax=Dothistroma septosporum (strain NZE10 / CBS 128990) TaxID=675120 RepID=N1PJE3_DOTSN|nr:hypothetical protein DOTSEDRAFT_73768 [Dothistroma septosporum NZE10]
MLQCERRPESRPFGGAQAFGCVTSEQCHLDTRIQLRGPDRLARKGRIGTASVRTCPSKARHMIAPEHFALRLATLPRCPSPLAVSPLGAGQLHLFLLLFRALPHSQDFKRSRQCLRR